MRHPSLDAFVSKLRKSLSPGGPYALVFLEDAVETISTIEHCKSLGFSETIVFGTRELLPATLPDVHLVEHDMHAGDAHAQIVNAVARACPGIWLHYCYNAEYLVFPFSESRSVREMIAFNTEERRNAVLTYVIDLYAADLGAHPNAVSRETAHFDASGYYALARHNARGHPLERQLDFHGGLRWRFEQFVPYEKRRIDRVALFKAAPGLTMNADHTFNVAEYNTYSCPWHHNMSAALCSFRTAKALMTNPGSREEITSFMWHHSAKFEWRSAQLLELGLIEPGQWF